MNYRAANGRGETSGVNIGEKYNGGGALVWTVSYIIFILSTLCALIPSYLIRVCAPFARHLQKPDSIVSDADEEHTFSLSHPSVLRECLRLGSPCSLRTTRMQPVDAEGPHNCPRQVV